MFGSATLTIEVSMIAIMTPSMTVAVTSATGGSLRRDDDAARTLAAAPRRRSGRDGFSAAERTGMR